MTTKITDMFTNREMLLSQIVLTLMAGYIISVGTNKEIFALRDENEVIDDGQTEPVQTLAAGLFQRLNRQTVDSEKFVKTESMWLLISEKTNWPKRIIEPILMNMSDFEVTMLESKFVVAATLSNNTVTAIRRGIRLPKTFTDGQIF